MFGKAKNEGRSAAEMYGKKSIDRIVRDQCKASTKTQKRGK